MKRKTKLIALVAVFALMVSNIGIFAFAKTNKTDAFSKIQAEKCDSFDKVAHNSATYPIRIEEEKGAEGRRIGYISDGNYVTYESLDFGKTAPKGFLARLARSDEGKNDCYLEVRLGDQKGKLLGKLKINCTYSWETYKEMSTAITNCPTGVQKITFVFRGKSIMYVANLDWFKFLKDYKAPVKPKAKVTPKPTVKPK